MLRGGQLAGLGPIANLRCRRRGARGGAGAGEAGEEVGRDRGDDGRAKRSEAAGGSVDLVSVLYVVGGIPCLIALFLVLFLLTEACDQANTFIPA